VSIGLFHGLVFLPVLLSIIGPRAYLTSESHSENTSEGDTASSLSSAVECDPKLDCVNIKSGKVHSDNGSGTNGMYFCIFYLFILKDLKEEIFAEQIANKTQPS